MNRVMAIIMAGGAGHRLYPLTRYRSKSAVVFGGKYRIVDLVLSNCVNSGLRKVFVLTQYRSDSLHRHIQEGWGISSARLGDYIYCIPAQQKVGSDWYRGTADAIRQNLGLFKGRDVDSVLILSGDHIYKMNYLQMVAYHRAKGAAITVSTIGMPVEQVSGQFGVLETTPDYRVIGFEEKPLYPKLMADEPNQALVSMGIYIFELKLLNEILNDPGDDFGKDVIPSLIKTGVSIFAYDYRKENKITDCVFQVENGVRRKIIVDKTRDSDYWRDVGTIDSYYGANMDLIGGSPLFNLYSEQWPFRACERAVPPSKFIFGGRAIESIVCDGCIISGADVRNSLLSPGVVVEKEAVVEESIIFDDVTIEPGAKVRRAIIDKGTRIQAGICLGYDQFLDKDRGCTISDEGITVVPKGLDIAL